MEYQYHDGGRAEAGYKGQANDCVTRAIAIITEQPYREVYRFIARKMASYGHARSARDGIPKKIFREILEELGFERVSTMGAGTGIQVHMRAEELPSGRLIVELSRHLAAVIDGTVYDNHDPRRDGTRGVYGFWRYTK